MHCAVKLCGHCQLGPYFVCADGPIFRWDQIARPDGGAGAVSATSPPSPRVAVFKMASCDGCQLQLLDAEEALLELAGAIEIVNFAEATSHVEPGPYDVTLVEGSISTAEQIEQVKGIREASSFLITIGACATSGGVQALRNGTRARETMRYVYPTPEYVDALADSTPVADHVKVDLELTGMSRRPGTAARARSRGCSRARSRARPPPRSASSARSGATSASWWPRASRASVR